MRHGERRRVEVPAAPCRGSPRFVEFGDPTDDEGSEEHFRHRTDRGALVFDLDLTGLCLPAYGVLLPGHMWSSRHEIACRPIRSIPVTRERALERTRAPRIDPGPELEEALLRASHGYGKDRDEAATVRALLQAGADPNAADAAGQSALALAAQTGNRAIPRLLFLAGAGLAGSKFDGSFALHRAAADGQREILRALLAGRERDPDAVDECGLTALHGTLHNEKLPSLRCVGDFTPDYEGVLAELLERRVDVRVPQGPASKAEECAGAFRPPGATALHYAASSCHERAVDLLLAQGAIRMSPTTPARRPSWWPRSPAARWSSPACSRAARSSRRRTVTAAARRCCTPLRVTAWCRTTSRPWRRCSSTARIRVTRESRSARGWTARTGRGFGRKGLKSARAIQRLLWWSEAKGVLTTRLSGERSAAAL